MKRGEPTVYTVEPQVLNNSNLVTICPQHPQCNQNHQGQQQYVAPNASGIPQYNQPGYNNYQRNQYNKFGGNRGGHFGARFNNHYGKFLFLFAHQHFFIQIVYPNLL